MEKIYRAVLEGELEITVDEVKAALDANVSASDILQNGLIAAMGEVGRLFETGIILSLKCWLQPVPCRPAWKS